jgi:peroxiredoxin
MGMDLHKQFWLAIYLSLEVAFSSAAGQPSAEPVLDAIPPVLLTVGQRTLTRLRVGDRLPPIELPRLGGATTKLASLAGKRATIVLFWTRDRWMARTALADLSAVAAADGGGAVSIVGVAVGVPAAEVKSEMVDAQVTLPQLLDTQETAFAQIGSTALPRIFVLNDQGKIVWFDIEYSQSTHRELLQTLRVLTTDPNAGGP